MNIPPRIFPEVELHPGLDIPVEDCDMFIPIVTALLVPEPNGVHQFVNDNPCVLTSGPDAHRLGATGPPDIAGAAGPSVDMDIVRFLGTGLELDASALLVFQHGFGNHAPLVRICFRSAEKNNCKFAKIKLSLLIKKINDLLV